MATGGRPYSLPRVGSPVHLVIAVRRVGDLDEVRAVCSCGEDVHLVAARLPCHREHDACAVGRPAMRTGEGAARTIIQRDLLEPGSVRMDLEEASVVCEQDPLAVRGPASAGE